MSIIEKDSLIFDIGANWGQSAQRYLDAGAGRIISVEPCLENYIVLQRKAALDPRIVPIHAAVWVYPKVMEARFSTNEPGWSSVQPEKWIKAYPNAKWGAPEFVPALNVGSLVGKFGTPFCIKIDVEGSEVEVLKGFGEEWPKMVVFEFHEQFPEDTTECLDMLEGRYTKATYTCNDLDLETEPYLSFKDFRARMASEKPKWGNITVA